MSTWTIEMFWDCRYCGTRCPGMQGKERGSLRCTHCGAEKADEPWLMPDAPETAPHLTEEYDRKAKLGPNWACQYCNDHTENRADKTVCDGCGAPRYKVDYSQDDKPVDAPVASPHVQDAPRDIPLSPGEVILTPPVDCTLQTPNLSHTPIEDTHDHRPSPSERSFSYGMSFGGEVEKTGINTELVFKIILGVGVAALTIGLLVWLFTPNTTTAHVTTMTWSRTQVLEERHSYAGEGWQRQAPPLVYSWDHCETRQDGTERCHPHDCNCHSVPYECNCTGGDSYECNCTTSAPSCTSNRNGSATCTSGSRSCSTCRTPRSCSTCSRTECDTCYDQCPVYAQWCAYHYYQWDIMATQHTEGNGHGAVWPNLEAQGDLQRVEATEDYHVIFHDDHSDQTWNRTYDFGRYDQFNVGEDWNIEWTHAGGFTLQTRLH